MSDNECVWLTEEGFEKATEAFFGKAAPDLSEIKVPSDPEVQDVCFGGVMKHFID